MKTKTFILTNPTDYKVLKNLSLGQPVYLKKSESDGNQKIVVYASLNNSEVEIGEFSYHRIDEFFEFIDNNSEGKITSLIDSSLDFYENKIDVEVSFEIKTEWPYAIEIAYEERKDEKDEGLTKKYLYLNCAEPDLEKIYNLLKSKIKTRYLIRATAPEKIKNKFYTWLIAFDYEAIDYDRISKDAVYQIVKRVNSDVLLPQSEYKIIIEKSERELENLKSQAKSQKDKNRLVKQHIQELVQELFTSIIINHNESLQFIAECQDRKEIFEILIDINTSIKKNQEFDNYKFKGRHQGCKLPVVYWRFSSGSQGGINDGRLFLCRDTRKAVVFYKKDIPYNVFNDKLDKLLR